MDILETVAIAPLDRAKADDHRLNELLEKITREIHYPLVTPLLPRYVSSIFTCMPNYIFCVWRSRRASFFFISLTSITNLPTRV